MSITDPNLSDCFNDKIEEIHNKRLKTLGAILDGATGLGQCHKQFLTSALDTGLKKCKNDDMMFETIQAFKKDLKQKSALIKEKQHEISDVISEINQKETQKDKILAKIQKLREEQAKRQEVIQAQNKANKDRLRNLQKARNVFQKHLGLEIRTILGKSQLAKGEKLQFVFRNINTSHPDNAYVVTMGITEDGSYQIVSSDPALECLPVLERRLQETNNLPAFLANVRKEFISLAQR
ncbi:kinetochore protein Spc25 [Nelusetta ayraudi]|uniref:kinetochore protein Spc25 n=1 Tax=Nelusetta ayraudi TaxID=303726 RepID=UPI003F6FDD92